MTTEGRPRSRWTKAAVRAVAWGTAGAAFLTGLGAIGAAPQPPAASAGAPVQASIVRRIVHRVVIVEPVPAPVVIPGSSSTTGGPGSSIPAPQPPASTSGGSHA